MILFAQIVEARDLSDQAIVLCSEKPIVNQLTTLYQQIDNVVCQRIRNVFSTWKQLIKIHDGRRRDDVVT